MSIDFQVYMHRRRIPSHQKGQDALRDGGIDLLLDPPTPNGTISAKVRGRLAVFDYCCAPLEADSDLPEELRAAIEDRHYMATFIVGTHGESVEAALCAAVFLAVAADGVFYDPQDAEFATGSAALNRLEPDEGTNFLLNPPPAPPPADAAHTGRRCPRCKRPCPSYRSTCPSCDFKIGRV